MTYLKSCRATAGEDARQYFAIDDEESEFHLCDTLEEARAKAEQYLEWAGDEASESGWMNEPPRIFYGVVLGGCEEESRGPAPEGSEFKEFINFRLTDAALAQRVEADNGSEHTAGPWSIAEHSWSDTSIFDCNGTVCVLSIADIATEETQEALEWDMARKARLIAAAPDLLAALEQIRVLAPPGTMMRVDADNAIAKATAPPMTNPKRQGEWHGHDND